MINKEPAWLVFADGTVFTGYALGYQGTVVGEVVFNTAMTGYQEIMTDPSYAGQLITFSYPHIGNTGVNNEDNQSSGIWARGIIVYEGRRLSAHRQTKQSLSQWLIDKRIVGIEGVDTRAVVHKLRDEGSAIACVTSDYVSQAHALAAIRAYSKGGEACCVNTVTTRCIYQRPLTDSDQRSSSHRIVVYDFGVKYQSLQMFEERGCHLTAVPAYTPAKQVLDLQPDGIFISNGPGDPAANQAAIEQIQQLLAAEIPVFGICLGHQLLALAAGARTYKMKFGHRGANHPVLDLSTGRVMITCQNHGFAVDQTTLPNMLKPRFVSLFDRSVQGLVHESKPWLSIQGHPESGPGPHDWGILFDEFITLTKKWTAYARS